MEGKDLFIFGIFILSLFSLIFSISNVQDELNTICTTENSFIQYRENGGWACHVFHYAEAFFFNSTTPQIVELNTLNKFENITQFTVDNIRGFEAREHELIVNSPGLYKVSVSASFAGGNSAQYEFQVFINGLARNDCNFLRSTSSVNIGTGSLTCLVNLEVGDVVTLKMRDTQTPVQDADLYYFNMNLLEII